jgi:hypothetical protein
MKIEGPRAGVTGAYTYVRPERWFFKVDGRYAYGSLDYEGSGTLESVPDSILEARAVFGKDFFPGSGLSLSPFVGFGYRYLYNDLRGHNIHRLCRLSALFPLLVRPDRGDLSNQG